MRQALVVGVLVVATAACVESRLVDCGDGRACPVGTVCAILVETDDARCAPPGDVEACAGKDAFAACDAGSAPAACYATTAGLVCMPSGCGNGLVDPGEVCDDRNAVVGDGCSVGCMSDETCGNGVVDPVAIVADQAVANEQCDDLDLVGHDGCSSGCQLEQPQWERLVIAPPDPYFAQGVAFDTARQRIVMFGGAFQSGLGVRVSRNDTWERGATGWMRMPAAVGPSPRFGAAMTYDAARRRVLLFGGATNSQSAFADTWEWDGTSWQLHAVATAPPARHSASMVYDPVRARVVMFGGASAIGTALRDHWEWDGTSWTEVVVPVMPSAREAAGMAYDPRRGVIVLGGGTANLDTWEYGSGAWTLKTTTMPAALERAAMVDDGVGVLAFGGVSAGVVTALTWRWDGAQWTQLAVTGAPAARASAALVRDPIRERVVLVGGHVFTSSCLSCTSTLADVWEWEPATMTWRDVTPGPGPSGRWYHAIAHDLRRGRLVMFGGSTSFPGSFGGLTSETWEFDGTAWVQHAGPAPVARSRTALAYDPIRGVTVLFGGHTAGTPASDTWTWDGASWTARSPTRSPPGRWGAAMAFDQARGVVVLFGGYDNSQALADTWTWDGVTWTQAIAPGPTPRRDAAMLYDPVRERVILFGGESSVSSLGDTWEWDGTTWTERAIAQAPPGRSAMGLGWNGARRRATVFGGAAQTFSVFDDTWELDAATWTRPLLSNSPGLLQGTSTVSSPDGTGVVVFAGALPTALTADLWRLRWQHAGRYELCAVDVDDDHDGLAGCADPDCWATCTPLCPPGAPCDPAWPRCGDGACDAGRESYRSCPLDCAPGAPACGDMFCDPGETAATCVGDCG